LQHFGTLGTIVLLNAFLVGMATLALETSWGLLAVDPDVAEPLAVVAVCEAGPGFKYFDLYNDVAGVGKGEDSL
jgi:hypothetical protein